MAEILEVKTVVETQQSEKSVDGLLGAMKNLADVQKESLESQKKVASDVEKTNKKAVKGTSGLSKGFKGVGLAIKGAGIGLLIGIIAGLMQAFKGNQKVMDLFSAAMDTLAIIGNKVATIVGDVVDKVSKGTSGFDKLKKTVTGLMTIALTPLKLSFYAISLGIQQAQLAWEQSMLGDNDPETVKNLTASIVETQAAIIEVGKDAIVAGKDVVENFGGAISEIGQVATGVMEGVKEISVSAAFETAKANKALEKSALISEAKIRGLIETYDLQAEKQRQIRDDDTKNIAIRIKANEELARILRDQQAEQTKLAQIGVDAASAKLAVDKDNVDSQVALQQALNEVAATAAQVAGFESEQQTNRNSLLKEQKQIIDELTLQGKSEQDRAIAEADQERTLRLKQVELFVEDLSLKKELIENIEQEHLNKISKINQEAQDKIDAKNKEVAEKKAAIKAEADAADDASNKDKADKEQQLIEAKIGFARQGFNLASSLAKEGSKEAKGIAIAQATFEAYQAVLSAYNSGLKSPITILNPSFPFIQAGIAAAFGAVQIKKIASSPTGGGGASPSVSGGGGGGGGGGRSPRIPDFTANNQGVGGGSGFGTVRAVVVNQDIKDTAQMDNRVSDLIRIGK